MTARPLWKLHKPRPLTPILTQTTSRLQTGFLQMPLYSQLKRNQRTGFQWLCGRGLAWDWISEMLCLELSWIRADSWGFISFFLHCCVCNVCPSLKLHLRVWRVSFVECCCCWDFDWMVGWLSIPLSPRHIIGIIAILCILCLSLCQCNDVSFKCGSTSKL